MRKRTRAPRSWRSPATPTSRACRTALATWSARSPISWATLALWRGMAPAFSTGTGRRCRRDEPRAGSAEHEQGTKPHAADDDAPPGEWRKAVTADKIQEIAHDHHADDEGHHEA